MAKQRVFRAWKHHLWLEIGPRSWGVWLFALLCLLGLRAAQKQQNLHYAHLTQKEQETKEAILKAHARETALRAQMDSQDDPAWMELVLKERLGLVPKGEIKILFENR